MIKKIIYFIGIKGVGMASLAIYLKEKGYYVLGSDSPEIFQTDDMLKRLKIPTLNGFKKSNLPLNVDLVINSAAYNIAENEELKEAKKRGIKILNLGEALGKFMAGNLQVSISGTHGKTTSTALTAWTMKYMGYDPSYFIGCADIVGMTAPGHYGNDKIFIAEADEYVSCLAVEKKSKFLWQNPKLLLITNIDFDHPDVFKDLKAVQNTFKKLITKVPKDGYIILNGDEENIKQLTDNVVATLIRFGYGKSCDYRIVNESFNNKKTKFEIIHKNQKFHIILQIPGKHNIINACGVFALLVSMGYDSKKIIDAFSKFRGSSRRIELIKEKNGVLYFDDYAHHPREIQATISAVKSFYPNRRIISVFQPHTFTRTLALFDDFSKSFKYSDINIILDVFSSAREKKGSLNVLGKKLSEEILKSNKKDIYYARNVNIAADIIRSILKIGDIVITLGAGDVYKLHDLL